MQSKQNYLWFGRKKKRDWFWPGDGGIEDAGNSCSSSVCTHAGWGLWLRNKRRISDWKFGNDVVNL